MGFALDKLTADMCPVIYKIQFIGDEGLFYLSDSNFSAFKAEQEILLQDGLDYRIISITEENDAATGHTITEVELVYPPVPYESNVSASSNVSVS
jgi:hypothetical protein